MEEIKLENKFENMMYFLVYECSYKDMLNIDFCMGKLKGRG